MLIRIISDIHSNIQVLEAVLADAPGGDFSKVRLVNAGNVGQPRDRDPRAAYLLIDTDEGTWEHRRVQYRIDDTAARIKDAGLPAVLWERLYIGY